MELHTAYQRWEGHDLVIRRQIRQLTWMFQELNGRMGSVASEQIALSTQKLAVERLGEYQSVVPDTMVESLHQLIAEGEAIGPAPSPTTVEYSQAFKAFRNKVLVFEEKLIIHLEAQLKTDYHRFSWS